METPKLTYIKQCKLSQEQVNKIIELRNTGMRQIDIAEQVGCTQSSVSNYIRRIVAEQAMAEAEAETKEEVYA